MGTPFVLQNFRGLLSSLPSALADGQFYWAEDTGQLYIGTASSGNVAITPGGGVFPISITKVAHEWLDSFDSTTGLFTQSQPAFTDISGVASAAQLPTPTLIAIGGVEAVNAVTHQWINSIDTSGVPHLSQPAYSDISGTPTLPATITKVTHDWLDSYDSTTGLFTQSQPAYTDISGTPVLPVTIAGVAHNFLTSYTSTTGAFTQAQPAFTDISGTVQSGQITATGAVSHEWVASINSDGTGNLTQPAFTDISGTATKAQLPATTVYTDQANTFGNFLQKFQAGANFDLVDPTDTTKVLQISVSGIATGTTRTLTIPNANCNPVIPSTAGAHQFATAISAGGVVTYTQPAFTDISGTATTGQLPATVAYTNVANTFTANPQTFGTIGTAIINAGSTTTSGAIVGGVAFNSTNQYTTMIGVVTPRLGDEVNGWTLDYQDEFFYASQQGATVTFTTPPDVGNANNMFVDDTNTALWNTGDAIPFMQITVDYTTTKAGSIPSRGNGFFNPALTFRQGGNFLTYLQTEFWVVTSQTYTPNNFAITGNVLSFVTTAATSNYIVGQQVSFTGATTATFLNVATTTNIALTSNVVTVTCANAFLVGQTIKLAGLTTATFLESQILTVVSASSTQFTAAFTHANYVSAADTGTAAPFITIKAGNSVNNTANITAPNYASAADTGTVQNGTGNNSWMTVYNSTPPLMYVNQLWIMGPGCGPSGADSFAIRKIRLTMALTNPLPGAFSIQRFMLYHATSPYDTFHMNIGGTNSMQGPLNLNPLSPGVATSLANVSSNVATLTGAYWTGSASTTDVWQWQNVMSSGSNPVSTMTLSHAGSSGGGVFSTALSNGNVWKFGTGAAALDANAGMSFVGNEANHATLSVYCSNTSPTNDASHGILDVHANAVSGTTYNLISGTNTTGSVFSVRGDGAVTCGAINTLTTAGQGFFIGPGVEQPWVNTTAASPVSVAGTQVRAFQFVCPFSMTITKISLNVITNNAGQTATVGIYSADGQTKLIDSGTFSCASIAVLTNTITAVTLQGGKVYWFAQNCSDITTTKIQSINSTPTIVAVMNNSTPRQIIPTTTATSGVMPSTLGTLASATALTSGQPIAAVFEP